MNDDLSRVSDVQLLDELSRRIPSLRCTCKRWRTYLGAYDADGYTIRCCGCRRSINKCSCR